MLGASLILAAIISAGPVILAPDTPTRVGSIEAVCTGVGMDARQNPFWSSYPLKIEIAGRGGQYLGDVHLTISQRGNTLASLRCDGPWVLLRLPAGKYQLDAETEGKSVSAQALVPVSGQGRVVLRFPDLGGAIEAPATASVSASAASQ